MVPKIRIKGNGETWKPMCFADMVTRNASSRNDASLPRVEYEDIVSGEGRLNKDIRKKKSQKKGIYFSKSEVLYGKLRPYLKNILLTNFEGIAVGDFWVFHPKCVNSEFLYYFVNSLPFEKVANITAGSKMPRADWNIVSSSLFSIPTALSEQLSIADFFKSLDSMISSTANKIAKLEQTKKACLQSMFPQEGERVPKVRFKGFEGEWEVVKLDDCLAISTERNSGNIYGKDEVLSVSDDFGVVNQISLLGRSYAGKSVENYKVLRTNQIVYTKSPLKSKPYGIVKVNKGETGIVSVLYAVYDAKEGVCPDYIHFYFQSKHRVNNYLLPLINKGAKNTMNISDETALEGLISIPSQKEQKMIADYLWSLEKMISLQSRRLSLLKHIKSACLDNMFV
jgi:type I restriction enzyme S subunit